MVKVGAALHTLEHALLGAESAPLRNIRELQQEKK